MAVCNDRRVDTFLFAVKENWVHVFKPYLENGLDVDSKDAVNGDTALHIACRNLNADVVSLLFGYGANPRAENNQGNCPMGVLAIRFRNACQNLHWFSAVLASYDVKQYHGFQRDVLYILEDFRDNGMVFDAKNSKHRTIVGHILPYATKDLVELLVSLKYDFHTADRITNRPMLHCLTECGNVEATKALLPHVDINGLWDMDTPLHIAAFCGNDKCARLFARKGCAVDMVNGKNVTALHTAFTSRAACSADIFWSLLKIYRSGVNSIVTNNSGLLELISKSTVYGIYTMDTEKLVILARHLITMTVAKFPVPDTVVPRILTNKEVRRRLDVSRFVDQCTRELEKLKVTTVCADLSMFDLLRKDKCETSWYINHKVRKYFNSRKYESQFRVYWDSLRIAYKLALKRKKLVDECEQIYCDILSQFNVPYPALRIILNNLDNTNLAFVANLANNF